MEIAARLAKVTALIISRDVVIDYALYGTPELAPVSYTHLSVYKRHE